MAKAKTSNKKDKSKASTSLAKDIVKARKGGATWAQIAEDHGLTVGKAIFIHECETVPEDEKFKGTDAAVTKRIVKARDDGMSWGQIAARAGWSEGRCKKAYFESGGEVVNVHRGGRYPEGADRSEIRPDLEEKASAKPKGKAKASAKKSAKKSGKHTVKSITGKFVTTVEGDKIKVEKASLSNGYFEVTDPDGDEWGFEMDEIAKVTAR